MREFNKLFIVALPRCATVSMSQAVGMLGIPTAHLGKIYGEPGSGHSDPKRLERMLQQIEAGDFQLEVLDQCRGLADYPACCLSVIQRLDQQYPAVYLSNVGRQHATSDGCSPSSRSSLALSYLMPVAKHCPKRSDL